VDDLTSALRDTARLMASASNTYHPLRETSDVVGVGTAADELVRAQVGGFGRLEELSIDPTLLRQGTTAIAGYVVTAVRAAQDGAQRQTQELLGSAAGVGVTAEMSAQLEQVAADATRGFDRMMAELDALTRRLDGR